MIAPKLPSFFKSNAHRQFEFKSRYYDAEEEDRKRRYASIAREVSHAPAAETFDKEVFRGNLKEEWKRTEHKPVLKSFSMIRLVLIVALLLYISYTILA
jgi:hypothetical protein